MKNLVVVYDSVPTTLHGDVEFSAVVRAQFDLYRFRPERDQFAQNTVDHDLVGQGIARRGRVHENRAEKLKGILQQVWLMQQHFMKRVICCRL